LSSKSEAGVRHCCFSPRCCRARCKPALTLSVWPPSILRLVARIMARGPSAQAPGRMMAQATQASWIGLLACRTRQDWMQTRPGALCMSPVPLIQYIMARSEARSPSAQAPKPQGEKPDNIFVNCCAATIYFEPCSHETRQSNALTLDRAKLPNLILKAARCEQLEAGKTWQAGPPTKCEA